MFRYVFGGAIATGTPLRYADFLAPGILVAGIVFAASRSSVSVAEDRAAGFTDPVRSLPVPRTAVWAGRLLADTTIVAGTVAVTLLATIAVGFRPTTGGPDDLAAAALLLGGLGIAMTQLFVLLGELAADVESAQAIGFVAIPLTFLSSAYVPTDVMPEWLRAAADAQPITHVVDALRATLTDADNGSLSAAVLAILFIATASTVGQVLVTRRSRSRS